MATKKTDQTDVETDEQAEQAEEQQASTEAPLEYPGTGENRVSVP